MEEREAATRLGYGEETTSLASDVVLYTNSCDGGVIQVEAHPATSHPI